jgi:diguanylate cyclase (GGDEF)-like protein
MQSFPQEEARRPANGAHQMAPVSFSHYLAWLRRRPLSIKLHTTATLAFLATLALAGTAHHFATATSHAIKQLHTTIVVTENDARAFTTELLKHIVQVSHARSSADTSHRIAAMSAIENTEQQMSAQASRLERPLSNTLHEHIARLYASSRALILHPLNSNHVELTNLENKYFTETETAATTLSGIGHQRQTLALQSLEAIQKAAVNLTNSVKITAALALLCIGPVSLLILRKSINRLRLVTRALHLLANNKIERHKRQGADDQNAPHDIPDLRLLQAMERPGHRDEITNMVEAIEVFHRTTISLNQSREELRALNQRFEVALDNMARGLSMFGPDERLIVCNSSYRRMYDLPNHLTVCGASLTDLLDWRARASPDDDDVPRIISRYRAAIAQKKPLRYTRTLSDGRIIDISLQPLDTGGWVTVHQDVTREREAEAQISRLANEDSLTNLVNRRGFTEALDRSCERAQKASETASIQQPAPFAVLCIDLDLFKSVNDTLGHPAGDEVLRIVAQRLKTATRQDDVIARIGGDEFAIIIENMSTLNDIERLSERLIAMLAEPMSIATATVAIGASIGIATRTNNQHSSSQILAQADMALYWAKSHGRNTWRIYDVELETPIKLRRQFENELRPALLDQQFSLNFQPILCLSAKDVVACEALLRWKHPQRGYVSPADFIPVAEKSGFINELGAWALLEACRAATTWPSHVRVAVNISPVQLVSKSIYATVVDALAKSGLRADRLELEITETALLDNSETTLATLHQLKALGIKISLDDFGTGYSSLSYLRAFPFDQLKIDQSFVRDISDRDDCVAIVKAVASLAKSLNMTTVAEGVETHDHLHRVNLAGCTAVQGYLFSKPVPAADVLDLFPAWRNRLAA